MGHLTKDHKVKGPSSAPKAALWVQDQISAAVAQALSQANLGTQASEGGDVDDDDTIEPKKGTTFKQGTKPGQGGFYTQVKNRLNPPGGAIG